VVGPKDWTHFSLPVTPQDVGDSAKKAYRVISCGFRLKEQVVFDYEETKDAKLVAAKHGVTAKQVWQWKSLADSAPERDAQKAFRALKKQNAELIEENALLREIVKKTALVMPLK